MRAALPLLLGLALVAGVPAAAAPGQAPREGVVTPGKSFAGTPLGLTGKQLIARWGRRYGVCDNCVAPTWYYTFKSYEPFGIAVQFDKGRVAAYFTLGAPSGWRTSKGLHIGDPDERVAKLYGSAPLVQCTGYAVYQLFLRKQLLVVYMNRAFVYGLGLATPAFNPCH